MTPGFSTPSEVWYVQGADPDLACPMLFSVKMRAEEYAREKFPDESPDRRYSRILCKSVC